MFISYAQNFEDVILWRALNHVENGFYVDVGAMDPTEHSVTKAFYNAGWNGINIEPSQYWFEILKEERINDINLSVVVGKIDGLVNFYEVLGTGLSSIHLDPTKKLADELGYKINEKRLPLRSLNTILTNYEKKEIHFLKIDVEGAENEVLEGIDLNKFRPWIILVESTIPLSQKENYEGWEHILTTNSYKFIYFDGLNRFFIANEHSELKEKLALPPNVFDSFKTIHLVNVEQELEIRQNEIRIARENNEKLSNEITQLQSEIRLAQENIEKLSIEKRQLQSEIRLAQENIEKLSIEKRQLQSEFRLVQENIEKIFTEKQQLQSELHQTKEKIEKLSLEKQQVWIELDKVYRSKSFLIMKPVREIAWFIRRLPGNFQKFKESSRHTLFSIIHHLRMLQFLSPLADFIKKTNPVIWSKLRNKLLNVQSQITIKIHQNQLSSSSELSEDEQYFLNLFEHEIENKKKLFEDAK